MAENQLNILKSGSNGWVEDNSTIISVEPNDIAIGNRNLRVTGKGGSSGGIAIEHATQAQLNVKAVTPQIQLDDYTNRLFAALGDGAGIGKLTLQSAGATKVSFSANSSSDSYINAGNFGVGTASPQHPLHVDGDAYIAGDLIVTGATTTIATVTLTVDDKNIELGSVDAPSDTTADGGGITLKGATDKTILWENDTDSWDFSENVTVADDKYTMTDKVRARDGDGLYIVDDGDNGIFVEDGGQVGIGTDAPSYLLDVQDHTGPVTLRVRGGDSYDSLIRFDQESTQQATVGYDHSSSLLKLGNHSAFGTTNHLVIDTDGNVGIGTATPDENLEITGRFHIGQAAAPSTTTDKLYNVGGALYWNGEDILSARDTLSELEDMAITSPADGNVLIYNDTSDKWVNTTLTDGANITITEGVGTISIASAHPSVSAETSVNNSSRTYIQDVTLDSFGHVTALVSASETVVDTNTNQLTTFDIGVDTNTTPTTIAHGETLTLAGGTNVSTETTSDGTVTITATDTNQLTTWNLDSDDSSSTAIGQGETVDIAGGTNCTTSRSSNVITIDCTDTNTNQLTTFGWDADGSTATTIGQGETISVVGGTNCSTARAGNVITVNAATQTPTSNYSNGYTLNQDCETSDNVQFASLGVGIAPSGSIAGSIIATNDVVSFVSSDERLKDNISTIPNPISKISQIKGVEFDWNEEAYSHLYGHDVGVLAQDVEKVMPEVVTTRGDGYMAVRYEKMVPLLIEGIKSQQAQIKELQDRLDEAGL